jgi:hypothetical protein
MRQVQEQCGRNSPQAKRKILPSAAAIAGTARRSKVEKAHILQGFSRWHGVCSSIGG